MAMERSWLRPGAVVFDTVLQVLVGQQLGVGVPLVDGLEDLQDGAEDEGSQLVAHVVGARPGERVLDLCAAPGKNGTW